MNRSRLRRAALLALAPLLPLAAATVSAPAGAEPPPGTATHVTSWNMHGGHNNSDNVAEAIAEERPQVVGLQEVCLREMREVVQTLKDEYHLSYYVTYGMVRSDRFNCGVGAANWNFGNAILSLTPMTGRVNRHYSTGEKVENRSYLAVTTTVDGRPARVFDTHLAAGGNTAMRTTEINELIRAAAPYNRVVIMGDFNTDPFQPQMQPVWRSYRDVDPHCGRAKDPACKPTQIESGKKFDYILLRGLTTTGFSVTQNTYSDHRMLTGFVRSA